MLPPHTQVSHFVILSPLGEGGMGQVYMARDAKLNRHVALKIIQPEAITDSEAAWSGAARLIREAQAAAGLEHPNVVTIYEVGELPARDGTPATPFIAMELVRGKSLRDLLGAPVPIRERIRWLVDVARALGAAHAAGIVHRDVKPENVMIRDDGIVKVLDFGLAKLDRRVADMTSLASLTGAQIAIGTPYYMAPEQMRREVLDGRADQFAWGVLAYELLSGEPPWGRNVDPLELVSNILTKLPARIDSLRRDVPPHVASVVVRALAKKREDRFASMEQLVAALQDSAPFAATLPEVRVDLPPQAPSNHERAALVTAVERPRKRRARTSLPRLAVVTVAVGAGAVWLLAPTKRATHATVAPTASPGCARHSECVAKNGRSPSVCTPGGACVLVASEGCTAMVEDDQIENEDLVWIGAMFPLSGDGEKFGRENMNAVDLARRDFVQATANLRFASGPPIRPLAVVACDDADGGRRAARHLAGSIHVPAVIGFANSIETIELATSTFVPGNVLTLASVSMSPLLGAIPHAIRQPRIVFRTTYNTLDTGPALAAFVSHLEAERWPRQKLRGDELRISVARMKNRSAVAMSEALFGALRFNGKSALDNGGAYQELGYERTEEFAKLAEDIARHRPHVVIASDPPLIERIEAVWRRDRPRPTYLMFTPFNDEVLGFLGKDRDRRRRMFGMTTISTTTSNARFVVHYNETFPEPITRTLAPNSTYDAFYVIAYAVAATADRVTAGDQLAHAVSRLVPPGTVVDVGPSGIFTALTVLRRGENVDLNGTTGRLDFDLATGDAPADLAIVCADVGESGEAVSGRESGLVFDTAARRLIGEMKCP
jgi:serine/threonine protein kinase/ABC-type branched-subunit amino acid transport system substrate-binding protein